MALQLKPAGTVALVVFLLAAGNTHALEGQAGLHFADYGDFDNGFGLSGQLALIPQGRISGSYTAVDDLDVLALRGGYLLDIDTVEVELGGGYQLWDFEGDFEDDVYGLHGIAEYRLTDQLSIHGKLEFLMFDNFSDETPVVGVGGHYDISRDFGLNLDAEVYTEDFIDETFIRLGGYYRF